MLLLSASRAGHLVKARSLRSLSQHGYGHERPRDSEGLPPQRSSCAKAVASASGQITDLHNLRFMIWGRGCHQSTFDMAQLPGAPSGEVSSVLCWSSGAARHLYGTSGPANNSALRPRPGRARPRWPIRVELVSNRVKYVSSPTRRPETAHNSPNTRPNRTENSTFQISPAVNIKLPMIYTQPCGAHFSKKKTENQTFHHHSRARSGARLNTSILRPEFSCRSRTREYRSEVHAGVPPGLT